jgi:predicted GNAT family acetyltransferase
VSDPAPWELPIVHNPEHRRFESGSGDRMSVLTYSLRPGSIAFLHAEVPPPLEGRGIAARITKTALDYARQNGLKVLPLCPYVAAYIRRHPEYQDLVAPAKK